MSVCKQKKRIRISKVKSDDSLSLKTLPELREIAKNEGVKFACIPKDELVKNIRKRMNSPCKPGKKSVESRCVLSEHLNRYKLEDVQVIATDLGMTDIDDMSKTSLIRLITKSLNCEKGQFVSGVTKVCTDSKTMKGSFELKERTEENISVNKLFEMLLTNLKTSVDTLKKMNTAKDPVLKELKELREFIKETEVSLDKIILDHDEGFKEKARLAIENAEAKQKLEESQVELKKAEDEKNKVEADNLNKEIRLKSKVTETKARELNAELDRVNAEKENAEKLAKIATTRVDNGSDSDGIDNGSDSDDSGSVGEQYDQEERDDIAQLELEKSKENMKKMYNDMQKQRIIENAQLAEEKHVARNVARINNKFSPEIEQIDISSQFSTEMNIQILRIQTRVIDHITTTFLDDFVPTLRKRFYESQNTLPIGISFPTKLGEIIKDYVQNIKRFACLETKYILHKARLFKGNRSLTRMVEESGDRLRDTQNIWKPKDSILRCNKLLSGTKLESDGIFEKMMLLMENIDDNTSELTSYLKHSWYLPFNIPLQLCIDEILIKWMDSLNNTNEISGYQLLQETTTHRLWESMLSNIQIYRIPDRDRPSTPRMTDDDDSDSD